MSARISIALCLILVAALIGATGLGSALLLRDAKSALATTLDDARVKSSALRDAAVAIARMRVAELNRQQATDPAQASYFALQAGAQEDVLRTKLQDLTAQVRSLPARQALARVEAAFADRPPATRAQDSTLAARIPSERGTFIIEEQFRAVSQMIDAEVDDGKAALSARTGRLEQVELSTIVLAGLLACAAWPLAGRLARPKRSLGEPERPVGASRDTAASVRAGGGEPAEPPDAPVVRALENAQVGVMLIDRAGQITFANASAMGMAGFVEILRASLSESDMQNQNSDICLADGRWLRVSRSLAGDGDVLALCSDVGDAWERLQRSEADNRNLRTALDWMSQGLCLFDAMHNLVVVNRRYCAIYGLDPQAVQRGLTGLELIGLSVAAGNHPGQEAAALYEEAQQAFAQGAPGPFIQKLGNGKILQIGIRPTGDGGFVATYEDVSDRWHAEARIAHMARHDSLTGLPNRVLLAERIDGAITQADRDHGFAVLCLDLDNFKPVNDALGHAVGDELLKAVAHRLMASVREIDTVARLGGDEFAIIRAGLEHAQDAEILAARIIEVVSEPYHLTHHTVTVGLSIGIALAPQHGMQADVLLKNADVALYRAKDEGRGSRRLFEPEMDARLQARRLLEGDLRTALAAEAFDLYYQPIYDLRRDRICGFEALLRWTHPVRGMISPAEFVPIAEEIGLIVPLGEWVVRRACAEAATWPDELKVAVNISAAQFQSAQLVDVIRSALEGSGLAPERLELEITESVLLVNGTATRDILHALRGLGARVSMDDFGTGYSSLSYLRSFPFDKMKIDRSFIRDLTVENGSGFIVRAVISLGSSLGMTMTAEGVETEEQLARLREEDCDEVQGFLFSPPVPVAQMPALLERWNSRPAVAA